MRRFALGYMPNAALPWLALCRPMRYMLQIYPALVCFVGQPAAVDVHVACFKLCKTRAMRAFQNTWCTRELAFLQDAKELDVHSHANFGLYRNNGARSCSADERFGP